jgi:hypothetical protein
MLVNITSFVRFRQSSTFCSVVVLPYDGKVRENFLLTEFFTKKIKKISK